MKNYFINLNAAALKIDSVQQKTTKAQKKLPLFKPLLFGLLLIIYFMGSANSIKAQNNALNFIEDYVSVDNQLSNSLSNQSAFTIEAWVKFDSYTRLATIFCTRQDHWNKIQFGLGEFPSNQLFFQLGSDGNISSALTVNSISLNIWQHVAAVFDGTQAVPTDRLKIYINGVLQTTSNPDADFATATGTYNVITYIGAEAPGWFGSPAVPLYGSLDETRIWTIARTQTEIQQNININLSGSEAGLLAYYNYNQGIPNANNAGITTLTDNTSANNDGTLVGFALNGTSSNWVDAPIAQSITFNALSDQTYGDVPFTISATGGASGNPVVFTSSNTAIATCSGSNGSTITIVGAGTCTIHANQAGNASYGSAPQVNQSLTIDPKAITITGVTANNKSYNRTNSATLTGGTLNGIETGDIVTLTAGTGTFASVNVGTGIVVTATGYSLAGADAGNYTVSQPTGLTADITAKGLTITGVTANDKVYDGTTPTTLTGGTLTGVETGDVVSFTAGTGAFVTANAGTAIVVAASGYSLTGTDVANYSLSQPTGISADITPRAVTVINTIVTTTKAYDGNTTAVVTSKGSLTSVLAIDISNLDFTVLANYNDALPSTNKTIAVDYTLTGTAATNYTVTGYTISNAIIEGTVPPSSSLLTSPGCSGDVIDLNYTVSVGSPTEYRIVFSQAAKDQGFTDISYTALPSSNVSDIISFAIPANAVYGDYLAEIQMRDVVGEEGVLESFNFTINLSTDFIITKFDDVVLCDNISNSFVSYQWYKDGVLIPGATNQYYNDLNGLSGNYSVSVVTNQGKTLMSCERYFNTPIKKTDALTIYPNPSKADGKFVVKINNLTTDDLQGAKMYIYNNNGVIVYSSNEVKQQNDIRLPINGDYYGVLITRNGEKISYKVIVIN